MNLLDFAYNFKRHPETVRVWIKKGIIRPKKTGKKYLFTDIEIEKVTKWILYRETNGLAGHKKKRNKKALQRV